MMSESLVYIIEANQVQDYTEYLIEVHHGGFIWKVKHRYSEFKEMHDTLRAKYPELVEKSLLPPKKLFGKMSPSFIDKRRIELEAYLQAVLNKKYSHGIPQPLRQFLHFQYYDVEMLCQFLAKTLFETGDSVLVSGSAYAFNPLQLWAITERLQLEKPPTDTEDPKFDFGHVLDFVQKLKHLHIKCDKGHIGTSNIIAEDMTFDLSVFHSLQQVVADGCSASQIRCLSSLRYSVSALGVHKSLTNLRTLLTEGYDTDDPQLSWQHLINADFSDNRIFAIDSSVKLLVCVEFLDLSWNKISKIENLENLSSLTFLDLSHNLVDEFDVAHARLGNVKTLILSDNKLRTLRGLGKLYSLEVLDVSQNFIAEISEVDYVTKLPCLSKLDLSKNAVTEDHDYRTQTLSRFGGRACELCLDQVPSTQKELDTAAVLHAILKSRKMSAHTSVFVSRDTITGKAISAPIKIKRQTTLENMAMSAPGHLQTLPNQSSPQRHGSVPDKHSPVKVTTPLHHRQSTNPDMSEFTKTSSLPEKRSRDGTLYETFEEPAAQTNNQATHATRHSTDIRITDPYGESFSEDPSGQDNSYQTPEDDGSMEVPSLYHSALSSPVVLPGKEVSDSDTSLGVSFTDVESSSPRITENVKNQNTNIEEVPSHPPLLLEDEESHVNAESSVGPCDNDESNSSSSPQSNENQRLSNDITTASRPDETQPVKQEMEETSNSSEELGLSSELSAEEEARFWQLLKEFKAKLSFNIPFNLSDPETLKDLLPGYPDGEDEPVSGDGDGEAVQQSSWVRPSFTHFWDFTKEQEDEIDLIGDAEASYHDVETTSRHDAETTSRHDAETTSRHDAETTPRHDAETTSRHDAETTSHHDADDTTPPPHPWSLQSVVTSERQNVSLSKILSDRYRMRKNNPPPNVELSNENILDDLLSSLSGKTFEEAMNPEALEFINLVEKSPLLRAAFNGVPSSSLSTDEERRRLARLRRKIAPPAKTHSIITNQRAPSPWTSESASTNKEVPSTFLDEKMPSHDNPTPSDEKNSNIPFNADEFFAKCANDFEGLILAQKETPKEEYSTANLVDSPSAMATEAPSTIPRCHHSGKDYKNDCMSCVYRRMMEEAKASGKSLTIEDFSKSWMGTPSKSSDLADVNAGQTICLQSSEVASFYVDMGNIGGALSGETESKSIEPMQAEVRIVLPTCHPQHPEQGLEERFDVTDKDLSLMEKGEHLSCHLLPAEKEVKPPSATENYDQRQERKISFSLQNEEDHLRSVPVGEPILSSNIVAMAEKAVEDAAAGSPGTVKIEVELVEEGKEEEGFIGKEIISQSDSKVTVGSPNYLGSFASSEYDVVPSSQACSTDEENSSFSFQSTASVPGSSLAMMNTSTDANVAAKEVEPNSLLLSPQEDCNGVEDVQNKEMCLVDLPGSQQVVPSDAGNVVQRSGEEKSTFLKNSEGQDLSSSAQDNCKVVTLHPPSPDRNHMEERTTSRSRVGKNVHFSLTEPDCGTTSVEVNTIGKIVSSTPNHKGDVNMIFDRGGVELENKAEVYSFSSSFESSSEPDPFGSITDTATSHSTPGVGENHQQQPNEQSSDKTKPDSSAKKVLRFSNDRFQHFPAISKTLNAKLQESQTPNPPNTIMKVLSEAESSRLSSESSSNSSRNSAAKLALGEDLSCHVQPDNTAKDPSVGNSHSKILKPKQRADDTHPTGKPTRCRRYSTDEDDLCVAPVMHLKFNSLSLSHLSSLTPSQYVNYTECCCFPKPEEQLLYVVWSDVIFCDCPNTEVSCAVFLSNKFIYFISDPERDSEPSSYTLATFDRLKNPIYLTHNKFSLCDETQGKLVQIVVGLYGQCVRVMGSNPGEIATIVTRSAWLTRQFLKNLFSILIDDDNFQADAKELLDHSEAMTNKTVQDPNTGLVVRLNNEEALMEFNLLSVDSEAFRKGSANPQLILYCLAKLVDDRFRKTPVTVVLTTELLCLCTEDLVSYPLTSTEPTPEFNRYRDLQTSRLADVQHLQVDYVVGYDVTVHVTPSGGACDAFKWRLEFRDYCEREKLIHAVARQHRCVSGQDIKIFVGNKSEDQEDDNS